ncbi:hypothetical protein [Clostridium peptidivorans]|uniref:hypothetical protein n=1 Tax=Clostridium peptidivorans TaxID=100174 RepID=UPI000BE4855A|nr:hypothetical protein [Clostridium peptidivorans]
MKKSKSLFEAVSALKSVTEMLFKKMPVLFLVIIYLVDLGIRSYLSAGWSKTYLLGVLILAISVGIYTSTKSFSETTLSFILGILTIYSIDWEKADFTIFILLYLAYIILIFYISAIRLAAKQESILTQAACKLDIDEYKEVYKRIKEISHKSTKHSQLSIIEKSEVIRYLAFRQVMIGEYEEAINIVELIKGVCQMDLVACCEMYYGLYTYCYNRKPTPPNVSRAVEKMFDKVTTLTISYAEFFEIFSNTKRILIEDKLSYDEYILEIRLLALKGYSSSDIVDELKKNYL